MISYKNGQVMVSFKGNDYTLDEMSTLVTNKYVPIREKYSKDKSLSEENPEYVEAMEAIGLKIQASSFNQYDEKQAVAFLTSQNPIYLNAKKFLDENMDEFIKLLNEKKDFIGVRTYLTSLMQIPVMNAYFGKMKFNLTLKHEVNGTKNKDGSVRNVEQMIASNEYWCSSWEDAFINSFALAAMPILRKDAIIALLMPQIYYTCKACGKRVLMTFNPDTMEVEEIQKKNEVCEAADSKLQEEYYCEVATKGKLIIMNDIRYFFEKSEEDKVKDLMHDISQKMGVFPGLGTNLGSLIYCVAYTQVMKAGYVVAGNHSCCINKLSSDKLRFYYFKQTDYEPISMDLWGMFVMDYEDFLKAMEKNGTSEKLKKIEHHIVDVEPGTYRVITDLKAQNDYENGSDKEEDELFFARVEKVSDETELKPLSEEDFIRFLKQ